MDVKSLKKSHELKQKEIQQRLNEFREIGRTADEEKLFEEMCFCVLTANTSAKMGINTIAKIKTKLATSSQQQLAQELTGIYRFPNKRSEYMIVNREFLEKNHDFQIRRMLESFDDKKELREFLVRNIKGFGYKEASHYLRNIGFQGLAILDKHIITTMHELDLLEEARAPKNKKEYLEFEEKLIDFCENAGINVDEMDLLMWSLKTGEILK